MANMFMSPASSDSLLRDLLDDPVARIADRVHRVAETDHDFLVRDAPADVGLRFVRRRIARWTSKENSLAPPCFGPRSAPMAPVSAE